MCKVSGMMNLPLLLLVFLGAASAQISSSVQSRRNDIGGLLSNTVRQSALIRKEKELMWCCLTMEELEKCRAFAEAARRDQEESDYTFGSYYRPIK